MARWRNAACARNRYHTGPTDSNGEHRLAMAPRHGFEPRFTAPKAAVLPLDDRGMGGKTLTPTSLALPTRPPQRALVQSSRKPILAGAGCGLQTRCAALASRVG